MQYWILIRTKVRMERTAQNNLEEQGYQIYLPMMPPDKRKGIGEEPMFPGYLFLRIDDQSGDYSPIRYTRGVLWIVSFSYKIATVPDAIIDELRYNEGQQEEKIYSAGDRVRVTRGPFKFYEAVIQQLRPGGRIQVLLADAVHPVEIDARICEPV